MQDMSPGEQQQAFAVWLRTGRRPTVGEDGVERKFNPYHDPRNGRFTFAPGGPQSLSRVVLSKRRLPYVKPKEVVKAASINTEPLRTETVFSAEGSEPILVDAVYRPDGAGAGLLPAQYRLPRSTRGSNSRAFEDPMTLEQIFPGLRDAPAGALLTLADNIFDLTGPRDALTAELTLEISGRLIQQIKEIDPSFRFESLGFPTTIEGQVNQINDLRFERAAALARMRGNYEPLQVEAIRFMARNAAPAYEEAVRLQNEGRTLRRSPTAPLSIGNKVDEIVLDALGQRLMRSGINPYGRGPVRLKRRTYTTPGAGNSFRIPDVRIDKLDIDLTIESKTLAKQQMRDFFRSTEPTTHVAIVRPPQTGQNAVYIIVNPGE